MHNFSVTPLILWFCHVVFQNHLLPTNTWIYHFNIIIYRLQRYRTFRCGFWIGFTTIIINNHVILVMYSFCQTILRSRYTDLTALVIASKKVSSSHFKVPSSIVFPSKHYLQEQIHDLLKVRAWFRVMYVPSSCQSASNFTWRKQ